ncbi:MAG: glycoside hydrolase family 97 catalytic domain-containing protein [Candidatus Moduliflexus flocculans]|nr:glycoside hydrolase family 97 catalytic domain-containing protein [Candidatus Moduliflexus flocculans]
MATLLWVEWRALDRHMDEAMALYEKWGAAGIKVDYMNRDDQEMVVYYEKVCRKAAEHRPDGRLPRRLQADRACDGTYPNLLTREGVMGLEYSKWSEQRHARARREHRLHADAGRADGLHARRGSATRRAGKFVAARHRADDAGDAGPPAGHVRRLREPARDGVGLSRGLRGPAGDGVHREGADRVGRDAGARGRARQIHRRRPAEGDGLVDRRDDELGRSGGRVWARFPGRGGIRGQDLRRRRGRRNRGDEPRDHGEAGQVRRPAGLASSPPAAVLRSGSDPSDSLDFIILYLD